MNLTFKIPQLAICFSTKPKKYVGTVLVLSIIFVGTKMVLFLVFIGTKIGLFFKITLPAKHQALPGLATNVQARFPYALSHKNAHIAKKSESCFGEKTKPFFKNLYTSSCYSCFSFSNNSLSIFST